MPAKLVVTAGDNPGQEFWIEEEVLRLGGGATCEIRLTEAGVPPHAVTLEYKDGVYTVYSRSEKPLQLDRRPLEHRDSARWGAGKELKLADGVTLKLVIDGDPAPAPRTRPGADVLVPEEEVAPSTEPEPLSPEAAAKASKTTTQIAVIVLLLVLLAGLLVLDSNTKTPEARNPYADFHNLVKDLQDEAGKGNAEAAGMVQTLQDARLAERREDRKAARQHYGDLRDRLLTRKNADGKLPEVEQRLWEFVIFQMPP